MATVDDVFETRVQQPKELQAHVNKLLGQTSWLTISQQDVQAFADLTGDQQWIHTDVARSQTESPFGAPIVHGYLLLSFCAQFIQNTLHIASQKLMVNYGLNKVRFITPVPVDSQVRGQNTLLAYEKNDKGIRLTLRLTIELKNKSKPACIAEVILLCVE